MKAIVERMGGEYAVVLLGREQYKVILPLSCLPEETRERDVLDIAININRKLALKGLPPKKYPGLREKIKRAWGKVSPDPQSELTDKLIGSRPDF
ncbi:MAG: DUF3006 domain-containing protein [Thermoanaerobacteraceae bacterium]|nr:DUF3006 domain-containing protein [Thermoanaerobacteraceae bacterium]